MICLRNLLFGIKKLEDNTGLLCENTHHPFPAIFPDTQKKSFSIYKLSLSPDWLKACFNQIRLPLRLRVSQTPVAEG
jgi:hypothetical protein